MSLTAKLATLALRPVLNGVFKAVLPGVEFGDSDQATGAVEQFLVSRFTDPSRQLQSALNRASDRSWRAVEIALSGESFWSRLTDLGEDKAFRADIRTFLDSNPLQLPPEQDDAFRRAALDQLRTARKTGLIPGDGASLSAAQQTTDFLRFVDPDAVRDAEWRVMAEIAEQLRKCGHAALADLLELRPVSNQPPLPAVAVRFFFRREVETNPQLFQGLVYHQVDHIGQMLETGLDRLQNALDHHGERLRDILALTESIHENVLDLKTEQAKLGEGFRDIFAAVFDLSGKLDRLLERNLRQSDATSIRGGAERQRVLSVKDMFRALPEPQRQKAPALLNAIGKLEMATGNYEEAHQDFRRVATMVNDRSDKAAAHHNAFLASLEKKDWTTALSELTEASRLDPDRFSLFPMDRYEPERILGAGGFGIVFLCRNRLSKARMVVKALRTDELDRGLSTVLEEAGALEQLHHEAIIRLRDCGCADANQTRPYLVMDFFDGVTLDDFVQNHGPLPAQDAKILARKMAEGLSAAHAKDILHRDVKPGNVMLERAPSGLRIKLIDFGLAMQQRAVHNTVGNADALSNTIRGRSIAGTVDYASPEQMGKLPGETISAKSDAYGYGRTLCFALFGTPKPGPRHWKELKDEPFGELIGDCIEESPTNRPANFEIILARIGSTAEADRPQDHKAPETSQRNPPSIGKKSQERFDVGISALPAPQVAASDLPPLPQDILDLEGRRNALRQTIESVEQGHHPDIREAWLSLQDQRDNEGQPLIDSLKRKIEIAPAARDSELCATAPDAPQRAVLTVINAFKRVVELKRESAEIEVKLATRQEEDFRGILARLLGRSEEDQFPLPAWLKLEPPLAARRYLFVKDAGELLHKAEEHFATIRAEREAERAHRNRERKEREKHEQDDAAWKKAEQRNTAEAYEEYLNVYPPRRRAEEAKQRAATLLRALLLNDLGNKALRKRYLACRTKELADTDVGSVNGWILPILGAIFGGVLSLLSMLGALPAVQNLWTTDPTNGNAGTVLFPVAAFFLVFLVLAHFFKDNNSIVGTIFETQINAALAGAFLFVSIALYGGGIGLGMLLPNDASWIVILSLPLALIAGVLLGGGIGHLIGAIPSLENGVRWQTSPGECSSIICRETGAILGALACPIGVGLGGFFGGHTSLGWILFCVVIGMVSGHLCGFSVRANASDGRRMLAEKHGPIFWNMLNYKYENTSKLE